MALIKAVDIETVTIKAKIPKSLDNQIKEYMKWVGLNEIGHFLEQSAQYILKNDKDWKAAKAASKSQCLHLRRRLVGKRVRDRSVE